MITLTQEQQKLINILCETLPELLVDQVKKQVEQQLRNRESFDYALTESLSEFDKSTQCYLGVDGKDVETLLFLGDRLLGALAIDRTLQEFEEEIESVSDGVLVLADLCSKSGYAIFHLNGYDDYHIFVVSYNKRTVFRRLAESCEMELTYIKPQQRGYKNFHVSKRKAGREYLRNVFKKAGAHAQKMGLKPLLLGVCGECEACRRITRNFWEPSLGSIFEGFYIIQLSGPGSYVELMKCGLSGTKRPFLVKMDGDGRILDDILTGEDIYASGELLSDIANIIDIFLSKNASEKEYVMNHVQNNAALIASVKTDDIENAIELIENKGAEINPPSFNLFACIQSDNVELAQYLLTQGADVHHIEEEQPPLCTALYRKNYKLAEFLVDNGARVDLYIPRVKRNTLGFAAGGESLPLLAKILAAGADVNHRGIFGKTAIFEAGSHFAMHLALIEAGADLRMQDDNGDTPLHALAFSFRYRLDICAQMIKLYLDNDANAFIENNKGEKVYDCLSDEQKAGFSYGTLQRLMMN
ncbi:ankyrin repeat domain-containing protein [Amphritea sp.]|uniref:ankyrin repeat domain-containing protein n=1 Tax=Amphritea sp. TaxID=1872502 RepID=UPI003D12A113